MSKESVAKIRHDWALNDAKRDAGLTTPENIKRFDNISYGPHGIENLLDVYTLKETKELRPTIISIHGGGWVYGDKELYQYYCMSLAQRGFTVVNYNYRLAPETRFPAQLEDFFAVLKWMKEHGEDYFIDMNNLFLVGDSAGAQQAHHVLTILNNPQFAAKFPFEVDYSIRFNACALNCGCYMLCVNKLIPPMDMTMTKDYLPQDYRAILPLLEVNKNMNSDFPPTFLMTAVNDHLKFMAPPMEKVLKKNNIEYIYKVYGSKEQKDVAHVFHINVRLKEGIQCNDEECEFFKKHLH